MKRSNWKTSISRISSALFLLGGERRAVGAGLDHLAQPGALLVRGEVLELVGDRAAVGLAHARQRLEQGLAGDADAQDRGRHARHQLRGQVERLRLDRRVALGLAAERVEAGGEVAVGAVALEQRGRRLHRLQQLLVGLGGGDAGLGAAGGGGAERRRRGRGGVGRGDRRRVDAEVVGDALVEAFLALQQLLDAAQEGAGLGALDHPVVVGRGQRHRLRDADLAQPLGGGVRPLGRVGDRAGGDDRALPVRAAAAPRRRCRSRPGWSARCWCPGSRRR